MDLFNYKHSDIEIKKEHNITIDKQEKIIDNNIIEEQSETEKEEIKEQLEQLISKNEELTNIMKNQLANSTMVGISDFFDKSLIDSLDKFHTFMKNFIPGLPPYYTKDEAGNIEISLQAYIDAKDFILNEFGFDEKNIVEEFDYNGNLNTEKMHFALDYSISANGNIYHGNDMLLNSNNKDKIFVDYIDFDKSIIKFKPGVFVNIGTILNEDKLKEELIDNNEFLDEDSKRDNITIDFNRPVNTEDFFPEGYNPDDPNDKNIYDKYDKISKDDVTLSDLEELAPKDEVDTLNEIKKIIMDVRNFPEGIQTCNTNKVNYLWLLFLIIIGGGSERKAPFPQDASICGYYRKPQRKAFGMGGRISSGGTYSSARNYRTGHNKLYNNKNRQGLKISLLQLLIQFMEPFFDINLSVLEFRVAGTHIKLLPPIDIGAFVEHCLLKFQEWISKEIRGMQGCDSQYIIPKIKDTGEGLFFDGMEELNRSGNSNDIEMYFRRNFAIIWNYTHYHSKYNEYTEDEKRDEMLRLYKTTKTSQKRNMTKDDIQKCYDQGIHIMFSDIVLDYHTGKASSDTDYGYISRIQPGSTVKIFAAKTFDNIDLNVDPSNVNKVIELGLYASYNCDMIDDLDLYEPDYSDSTFQPEFIM